MDPIIGIGEKEYPLKFSMMTFRSLGRSWKLVGTQAAFERLAILDSMDSSGLSFEQEDLIVDVILAGMSCAGVEKKQLPTKDDVYEHVLFDPDKLQIVFDLLEEAVKVFLPKGKPMPAKT